MPHYGIGTVRIRNGQVVEEIQPVRQSDRADSAGGFQAEHPITDAMVADASPARSKFQLLEFIGGAAFAAFNAKFDYSFLTEECNRLGIEIHMPVIDTLEFSAGCTQASRATGSARSANRWALQKKRKAYDARATALSQPHARHRPERRASPG